MADGLPGYWMNETTGVLRPAVEAYLRGEPMEPAAIVAMRAYLRQWMAAPTWHGAGVDLLRQAIDRLTSREAIDEWLELALDEGIDPL
jgi:hypothetical protein